MLGTMNERKVYSFVAVLVRKKEETEEEETRLEIRIITTTTTTVGTETETGETNDEEAAAAAESCRTRESCRINARRQKYHHTRATTWSFFLSLSLCASYGHALLTNTIT